MKRSVRILLATLAATLAGACGSDASDPPLAPPADARPSFLLIVVDTLRADAVSAHGEVVGTTPRIDALAAEGLRYARAFAPAPWTPPSHATLFTGLPPEEHGVGVNGRVVLPDGPETLAARLSAAGWETVGFSENPIVSPPFHFGRGFDHFEGELNAIFRRAEDPEVEFDVVRGVRGWLAQRDATRPFFVFVNLFDPHDPYELREERGFLPEGVSEAEARRVGGVEEGSEAGVAAFAGICDRLPPTRELEILRGLYLGEVAAADAKVGTLHDVLSAAAPGPLVTVVTSDHGEHLGEHRLLGHEFSVRSALLHVPLVVHGHPQASSPAVVDAPVGLEDVMPSVLAWAGVPTVDGLPGQPLPLEPPPAAEPRALRALYDDGSLAAPEGWESLHDEEMEERRRSCDAEDRVFGDMLSLVRFPWKLNWYARHPPELYDLRWDDDERSDVAAHHPERTAAMARALETLHARLAADAGAPREALPEEAAQRLRALGYAE